MGVKTGPFLFFLISVLICCFSSGAIADDIPMIQDLRAIPAMVPASFGPVFPIPPDPMDRSLIHRLPDDQKMVRWIRSNISPKTGLFKSFQVLPEDRQEIYAQMGTSDSVSGVIERVIVEEGLVIYDGAVAQIALMLAAGKEGLEDAQRPLQTYWKGSVGELMNIRAGFPNNNFVYDPQAPEAVVSNLDAEGRRGFIFRIINANGNYLSADPLDGKTEMEGFPTWPSIHWEDWKPVAGENAWVVMAAMHLYHKKFFDDRTGEYTHSGGAVELKLAEELARAALLLQSETGGIRMAPLGTFRENGPLLPSGPGSWWYNQISTENNFSWYSAFRMLYKVTGKAEYAVAMEKLEGYFQQVFDREGKFFYQGMNYSDGTWQVNRADFAVDVQTWGVLALGADVIDRWFGDGAAYSAWRKVRDLSATRDENGRLLGVGYTAETGRVSAEWSAGAIMAARQLADLYRFSHSDWSQELQQDAWEMRAGMELLRRDINEGMSAYAYSSKRGWIPFGWNSHDPRILSLASTGWVIFVDRGYNPFNIDGHRSMDVVRMARIGEARKIE